MINEIPSKLNYGFGFILFSILYNDNIVYGLLSIENKILSRQNEEM